MKVAFFSKVSLMAVVALLAACGPGQSHAQTIPGVFKSSQGVVASVKEAVSVRCYVGNVYALQSNLSQTVFDDAQGTLCPKIMAYAAGAGWLQVNTANYWFNPEKLRTECFSNQTKMRYLTYHDQNYSDLLADACSIHSQMSTRATPP